MKPNTQIYRDENGTPHVEAATRADMYWGQGYVHARDRGMQMLMMRVLGQGRLCELLNDSDESLSIDIFFRRMNWHNNLNTEFEKLSAKHQSYIQSYTDGVNTAFAEKTPWEFKLLGYKPEKWSYPDSIIISRMVGYLTLAQSQAEMERLFVEMVQADIAPEKLEELFPGNLGELDIDLLKKVQLGERIVNPASLWNLAAPRMMASNNWVISGARTKSGQPILANDPHLEVNRLPSIWSEMALSSGGRDIIGGTMPGAPGVFVGRTPDIAWGVTYAFTDAVDSWVENCKDGKYLREDQWLDFNVRTETIKRKKQADQTINFYENSHGTLDGDPHQAGLYLATRWTASDSGALVFGAFCDIADAATVPEGMDTLGQIETGWNFVLADTAGNIGFQMTGIVPKRRAGVSGFVPLPGWKAENDWVTYLNIEEMPRVLNPETGFFATANDDLNRYGVEKPINMPMGSYRAERIRALLAEKEDFTVEDVFAMHADLYSLQAERFMKILHPLLPETPQGEILKSWDYCYDAESQGAYLFEAFYKELYREVFGKNGFGENALDFLYDETGTFIDFYQNFDRILLAESSNWFGKMSRGELYRKAAEKALSITPKTWGSSRQFVMSHMLFGGTLPSFLGFDHGPITGIGGRATIHQGQIYRSAGRTTTFMPSLRIVTDLASENLWSNLIGGPSDRRFSKWYLSDLKNWLNYRYKVTRPGGGEKLDF
ncbi:MAG: penicillin acylase family protein [Chloroflexota bacterium]